jgi:hypothetical protein
MEFKIVGAKCLGLSPKMAKAYSRIEVTAEIVGGDLRGQPPRPISMVLEVEGDGRNIYTDNQDLFEEVIDKLWESEVFMQAYQEGQRVCSECLGPTDVSSQETQPPV